MEPKNTIERLRRKAEVLAGKARARWYAMTVRGLTMSGTVLVGRGATIRSGGRGANLHISDSVIDDYARLDVAAGAVMRIEGTYIGRFVVVAARESVQIGLGGQIAEFSTIRDHEHVIDEEGSRRDQWTTRPVSLGAGVWCGSKVTVTAGVEVGASAVIGANSVVTRSVPARTIAAGAPARVIRALDGAP